ncbi:MAG: hypothetical protein JNK81_11365 [Anaerolineales bacterium]|nr:hypothetical protein [Anaerolineales bacterium]
MLNRFIQPDTIVPNPMMSQSWNRFSYVRNNPINFIDPTGHWECNFDPDECAFLKKHNSGSGITINKSNTGGGGSSGSSGNGGGIIKPKNEDDSPPVSAVATFATVLDTIALGMNGAYAVVGDIVGLVCNGCYPYVVGAYQYYSFLPNIVSTISMGLWIMEGVDTGENNLKISKFSKEVTISLSVSQDTIVAVGTNIAGWTVLKEPNVAFAVDAAVATYDYGRLGAIPFVGTIPTLINPTFEFNSNTGFDFSWNQR